MVDADGATTFSEINHLTKKIISMGNKAIVVGSRSKGKKDTVG